MLYAVKMTIQNILVWDFSQHVEHVVFVNVYNEKCLVLPQNNKGL